MSCWPAWAATPPWSRCAAGSLRRAARVLRLPAAAARSRSAMRCCTKTHHSSSAGAPPPRCRWMWMMQRMWQRRAVCRPFPASRRGAGIRGGGLAVPRQCCDSQCGGPLGQLPTSLVVTNSIPSPCLPACPPPTHTRLPAGVAVRRQGGGARGRRPPAPAGHTGLAAVRVACARCTAVTRSPCSGTPAHNNSLSCGSLSLLPALLYACTVPSYPQPSVLAPARVALHLPLLHFSLPCNPQQAQRCSCQKH